MENVLSQKESSAFKVLLLQKAFGYYCKRSIVAIAYSLLLPYFYIFITLVFLWLKHDNICIVMVNNIHPKRSIYGERERNT